MSNTNLSITWSDEQNAIYNWFETGAVPAGALFGGCGDLASDAMAQSQNLITRARAGTGKSTTIREGVNRAPERSILIAAFNKSIATDMQKRINNPRVEVKTLHGLGFKFVGRSWHGVKVEDQSGDRAWALAKRTAEDAPDPVIKLIADLHTKARELIPFAALKGSGRDLVDVAVRFNIVPDDEWEDRGWGLNEVCAAAHKAMVLGMERCAFIDFADMIFLPLVHNMIRPWYQLVVVDEAQDMTIAQLELATRCCKRDGRICIVGDDRQAIYGFRGADSGSLDRLKTKLQAAELGLKTTYRCCKLVVNLAKKLVPDFSCPDTAPDGEITRSDVDKMLETAREGDFILSRTNAPLAKICLALLKRGRRARIKGKDIGRGITTLIKKTGATQVSDLEPKLVEYLNHEVARAEKLPEAARAERIDFVHDQVEIIRALSEGTALISELRARCEDLFADDAEKQAIMCSSVHKAKGLEANKVHLLEGTFRGGRSEEDNIKYVAITRARLQLVWVSGFESAPKAIG